MLSITFSLRSVSLTGREMALEGAWVAGEVSVAIVGVCYK